MATAQAAKRAPARKPTSGPAARSPRSGGRRSATSARRYGSESPRLWTKPLRPLNRRTSLGYAAVDFAAWVRARLVQLAEELDQPELVDLAPALLPWQRWFLIHALELLPGPEMTFRFRTVLLLVARQNGKTSVLVYLILWRLFQDGAPMIIGAAQNLDVAEETWQKVVDIAEAIPELADELEKVSTGNGKKFIKLDTRERYRPQASNRRGGRGWSGDMVLLDELREHQTWDAWAAISKTTMARDRAQVYGVSNAGDSASLVLRHLRKAALASIEGRTLGADDADEAEAALEFLDEAAIGLFEWSAADGRTRWDKDGWYEANPSLGHTIKEAAIASAASSDPDAIFRTEVLCQFVDTGNGGPFPDQTWHDTKVAKGSFTRDPDAGFVCLVDTSFDRKTTFIGVGFFDTEGRPHMELAAQRAGTDWVIPWFQSADRKVTPTAIALQTKGAPASSLTPDFEEAGIEIIDWSGPDLGIASGILFDWVTTAHLATLVQPVLDIAATTAFTKPAGDGWLIDRKNSPQEAAPLVCAAGVVWLLKTHALHNKPSVYETRGLRSV